MSKGKRQEFSKLQLICSLFADTIGDDLYFARQIKESIEAALPQEKRSSTAAFVDFAEQLALSGPTFDKTAVGLVPVLEGQGFSMLTLRARLLTALKKTCRFERPLVVLTGLNEAICPQGKRWTQRRKQEYDEAIEFSRSLCVQRSRPSSKLSLVIF